MTVAPRSTSDALPRLLLFPFNGNAMEALDCVTGSYEVIGFIDDSPEKIGRDYHGLPVLTRAALTEFADAHVLAVPGSPKSYRERAAIVNGLGVDDRRFARVVHPAATISEHAKLGGNVLIMAGVVITSNAEVQDHVCILPNTVVHHDVVVGEWSLIGSNVSLAGSVVLGKNCYVGSGTSIRDGIRVGDHALIGLGSTVTRDVLPGTRVAGSPAKEL